MHVPGASCQALYRLHPQLRFAWAGARRKGSELNPGTFALVQLYHISDCGDIDDPFTFREYWHVTTQMDEDGWEERVRIDRGPIFNRFGGTTLDYDPHFRFPIYKCDITDDLEYPWGEKIDPIRDVYSGKIIEAVKYWLRPIEERIAESYVEKGNRVSAKCEDMALELSDRIWKESQQTDYSARRDFAYKHVKKDIAKQDHLNQRDPIKEYYKPPKMPSKEVKQSRHG